MKKEVGIIKEKYEMLILELSSIGVMLVGELVAFKNLRFWM